MQFEFIEIPKLPSLAWCAKIVAGQKIIKVIHGPGIETSDTWFYEGAWDNLPDEPGFAEATYFTGTGARIINDYLEFVSPTFPYRGLVIYRSSDFVYISNSIPFLLVMLNDYPDIEYQDYYVDLFKIYNNGCVRMPGSLKMKNGSKIYLHVYCSIRFTGISINKIKKPIPDAPESFEDYRDHLIAMLTRLRENATCTSRKQFYHPLLTVSRGYDSVACTALGKTAGWKDSITLVSNDSDQESEMNDDGSPVADCLGISVEKIDMHAWQQRSDVPESEFVATAWGGVMVRLAGLENKLRNTALILGIAGDRIWDRNSTGVGLNWNRPRTLDTLNMGVESLWEFQLRVGIINIMPATYLGMHWNKLRNLMSREELKNWSIGGEYDRPFARRLAEELGVPRELFGQNKMAHGHVYPAETPSEHGVEDYARYLEDKAIDKDLYINKRLTPYHFHWGIEHCMRSYDVKGVHVF